MRALPPCKKDGVNCTKRSPGCHSKCEEYAEFIKQKEAEDALIKKQREESRLERQARAKRIKF